MTSVDIRQYSTEGTSLGKEVRRQGRMAARDALKKARLLQPYLANFLQEMQLLQTEELGTFAVTPDLILIYNPLFVLGKNSASRDRDTGRVMTSWEFGIAFLHESLHVVFNHFSRWNKYRLENYIEENQLTARQWNIAGDCEINVMLRKVHPINPVYEELASALYTRPTQLGMDFSSFRRLTSEQAAEMVRAEADRLWSKLPLERQYPPGMAEDWPHDGVSMPKWFCFPETSLRPAQGPKGTAEDYYPFVPLQDAEPPPPGGKRPDWEGYKPGDRVVNTETGEEAVVVTASRYNPDGDPPQRITVKVTNHWTERSRTLKEAEEIGAIERAKQAAGVTPEVAAETAAQVKARNKARAQEQSQARSLGDAFTKARDKGQPGSGYEGMGLVVEDISAFMEPITGPKG